MIERRKKSEWQTKTEWNASIIREKTKEHQNQTPTYMGHELFE